MAYPLILTLAVSTGMVLCTVVIHALALITIVHFFRHERRLGRAGIMFWRDVSIVARVVLLAFAAHLLEISAWAVIFALCGEFSSFASAFDYSAENYTTLGDGDVVMSAAWKILRPLEATDGMLLFGVSIAMIFWVIQRLVQSRYPESRS